MAHHHITRKLPEPMRSVELPGGTPGGTLSSTRGNNLGAFLSIEWSIALWIKPLESASGTDRRIFTVTAFADVGDLGSTIRLIQSVPGNTLRCEVWNENGDQIADNSMGTLSVGSWTWFMVTKHDDLSTSPLTFWRNGSEFDTPSLGAINMTPVPLNRRYYLGDDPINPGQPGFRGRVAEIGIWDDHRMVNIGQPETAGQIFFNQGFGNLVIDGNSRGHSSYQNVSNGGRSGHWYKFRDRSDLGKDSVFEEVVGPWEPIPLDVETGLDLNKAISPAAPPEAVGQHRSVLLKGGADPGI